MNHDFIEYPKCLYAADGRRVGVKTADEEAALNEKDPGVWRAHPNDFLGDAPEEEEAEEVKPTMEALEAEGLSPLAAERVVKGLEKAPRKPVAPKGKAAKSAAAPKAESDPAAPEATSTLNLSELNPPPAEVAQGDQAGEAENQQ